MRADFVKTMGLMFAVLVVISIGFGSVESLAEVKCEQKSCIPLSKCPQMFKLLVAPNATKQHLGAVLDSYCGLEDYQIKVCCPYEDPRINSCVTPNGLLGECVNIYSCRPFIKSLTQKWVSHNLIHFIKQSICEDPRGVSVCCALSAPKKESHNLVDTVKVDPEPEVCPVSVFPPQIESKCCGVQSLSAHRIYGGKKTTLDQFPWLALVEYETAIPALKSLLCGATLISSRYVLTAGHCVTGKVLRMGKPVSVRLGEYNKSHSGPDCYLYDGTYKECNEGVTIIAIEKITPHPQFIPNNVYMGHDISLIRLKEDAPYTTFIRPICLPTREINHHVLSSNLLYAAGWGAVDRHHPSSNIKLSVGLPYWTRRHCQDQYKSVRIRPDQLCAGGVAGKDSCTGDSGGPLMNRISRDTYELVGVISFGPNPCGVTKHPGVYTKVYSFLDWIYSNIEM